MKSKRNFVSILSLFVIPEYNTDQIDHIVHAQRMREIRRTDRDEGTGVNERIKGRLAEEESEVQRRSVVPGSGASCAQF